MDEKQHDPEQAKIRDLQSAGLPVEIFRQMKSHNQQYRRGSQEIEIV
jgi:hypothetical protein